MPRSGGKGKGGPKRDGKDIGRALIKMHLQGTGKLKPRYANKLISILDNNALDDFIDSAEMEGNDFEVKRVHQNHAFLLEATTHRSIQALTFSAFGHEQLSIPRKPAWTKTMTAEEVDRNEKNAFLQWRRDIAAIEANDNYIKKVTPFEKNLDVWRQLWRVCERSDLVIQIVDARNPLLYYTKDLMRYVSELKPPRKMILLVNKADYLTEYQRLVWAQYFTAIGVRFAFYSAHIEQNKLDAFGLVEDYELNDINDEEIRWIAKDLATSYTAAPSTKPTDNLIFNPTAADNYLANERSKAEEIAAAEAATAHERPATIPEAQSEDDEEEDNSEASDESGDEESDAESVEQTSYPVKEGAEGLPSSDPATAENEAPEDEEQEEEDFTAYVQKAQGRKLRGASSEIEEGADGDSGAEESDEEGASEAEAAPAKQVTIDPKPAVVKPAVVMGDEQRRSRLLTRGELMLLLEYVSEELQLVSQDRNEGRICVGLVGYPNVGKSSCINTLLGVSKSSHGQVRVGVSSTPGKTKHFQTLILSDSILLCDCPGLVFPSFMNSTGEMLCAGILPINQMKDYQEPAEVIASRIPQYLLEAALGIKIYRHLDPLDKKDRPPTPAEMLGSYCESRGYITNGTGRWDEFRATKDMLILYTDGKLLNVALPPFVNLNASTEKGSSPSDVRDSLMARWIKETERVMARRERVAERVAEQKSKAAAAAAALEVIAEESRRATAAHLASLPKSAHEYGGMVFEYASGGGAPSGAVQKEVRMDANGYEFVDDESSEDGLSGSDGEGASNAGGKSKREHKRLKTWGKKNRKLRSKDPYMDVNNLVAYSTNRAKGAAAPVVTTGREKEKLMRQSTQTAYGSPFVRAVLPHHQANATAKPSNNASASASKA